MRILRNAKSRIYHLEREVSRLKTELDAFRKNSAIIEPAVDLAAQDINDLKKKLEALQKNASQIKPAVDGVVQDTNDLKIGFDKLKQSVSEVKPTIDETNKDTKHDLDLREKNRKLELAKADKEIAEAQRETADAKGKFLERPTLISGLVLFLLLMILGLVWSPMLSDTLSSRPDPKSVQMAYETLSDLQIRILRLQQKDTGDKIRDEKIKELLVRVKSLETTSSKVNVSVKNDN